MKDKLKILLIIISIIAMLEFALLIRVVYVWPTDSNILHEELKLAQQETQKWKDLDAECMVDWKRTIDFNTVLVEQQYRSIYG